MQCYLSEIYPTPTISTTQSLSNRREPRVETASSAFPTPAVKPVEWPRTGIGEVFDTVRKVAILGPTLLESINDAIEDDEGGGRSFEMGSTAPSLMHTRMP